MASVKHVKGDKWQVTISAGYDEEGKRKRIYKTITAKTEKQAKKLAKSLEGEIEKGDYIESSKYTFKDYTEKYWLVNKKIRLEPKTIYEYENLLKNYIYVEFGNKTLDKIDPLMIETFYNKLRTPGLRKDGGTLSENTIKHYHQLITSILQSAQKKKLIKENPCNLVEIPMIKKKESKFYDESQINNLLQALKTAELKYKAIVYIALFCGLRLGEILGLNENDINFDKNEISITKASQYLPTIGVFEKEPKNESSNRIVAMPKIVMDIIKEQILDKKKQQIRLGSKWKSSNKLFIKWNGEPMYTYAPSKWFNKFLKKNNLPPLPFHGLRHTAATYLINQGMDVKSVSTTLGHSKANTTLNIYAHSFKKANKESAEIMDNLSAKFIK